MRGVTRNVRDRVKQARALSEIEDILASEEVASEARLRHDLAEAVADRSDLRPTPVLLELLEHDIDSTVRAAAARLLSKFDGHASREALLRACESDRAENVVLRAAESLGRLSEAAAVPRLTDLLRPGNGLGARLIAATSLGQIGTPAARAALRQVIDTQAGVVVGAAAKALVAHGDTDDASHLRDVATRSNLRKRRQLNRALRSGA